MINGVIHAMILDAIEFDAQNNSFFVFKNTDQHDTQIRIATGISFII